MTRRLPLAAFRPSAPEAGSSGGAQRTRPAWWPWSVPAAMRTLRAVLVVPSVFALGYVGFGNLQLALFAAFGGFANLVVASFGGSRRDKAVAHFGLALTGSAGLIIGTAINGIDWLAVLVTIPVTFGIFFAGVAGPNAASGVIAALFPFVLSVATPGTVSMIPDRLAGWWLASAASTVAVLVLRRRRRETGCGRRRSARPGRWPPRSTQPRAARRSRPTTRPARPPSTS